MRILCAVDGSEYGQWAVGALEALAEREPEQVTIIHVVDRGAIRAAQGNKSRATARALSASEQAGRILLRDSERLGKVALSQAISAPRTAYRTVLAYGPPASTIASQARRLKTDLILIGSRGLSDIKTFLLGSVSRRVAASAPCPVWIVKQPVRKLARVTLAVDDTRHSRTAATFLRTRVLPQEATVTILSSVESTVTKLAARHLSDAQLKALNKRSLDRAAGLVQRLRNEFLKDGYAVVTAVEQDHVVDTIVTRVEADRADLVVIGSRGVTKAERLHLGSVSETVLQHAPCSVLVVRGTRA